VAQGCCTTSASTFPRSHPPLRTRCCAGKLQHTLRKHTGAILSGRWSKQGDMLLTGSVDNTAVVWDAQTGDIKQVFSFHTGGVHHLPAAGVLFLQRCVSVTQQH
jgi:WD40 repeat protein